MNPELTCHRRHRVLEEHLWVLNDSVESPEELKADLPEKLGPHQERRPVPTQRFRPAHRERHVARQLEIELHTETQVTREGDEIFVLRRQSRQSIEEQRQQIQTLRALTDSSGE